MKRACETCAAWTKNKQNNDGYCFATPRDMVPKENNAETGKDCRCLQWQPRERGTCGDCEFGRIRDGQEYGGCGKNATVFNATEIEGTTYITRETPGCGDWMPKRETTDGN